MNIVQAADVNLGLLKNDNQWAKIPSDEILDRTVKALKDNNIDTEIVKNTHEARKKVLSLLPEGAEVMTMISETLDSIGLSNIINESGRYDAIKPKLFAMDREKDGLKMQKMGAAPEWVVGSVHAITQDGKVLVASNSGSQLPAYAYGSAHVVWVVGAQKIVKDLDDAFRRLDQYTVPLEAVRANKAYGTKGSYPSKILIINQEIIPGRIKIVLVKEDIGF